MTAQLIDGNALARQIRADVSGRTAALKARGVEVEYMVKDNEGHGFHNDENKFEFYEAMERFLAEHLKP